MTLSDLCRLLRMKLSDLQRLLRMTLSDLWRLLRMTLSDLWRLLIIVLRMGKHWAGKWPKERQGWEMTKSNWVFKPLYI